MLLSDAHVFTVIDASKKSVVSILTEIGSTIWLYFYPTVTKEPLQVVNYGGITAEVD